MLPWQQTFFLTHLGKKYSELVVSCWTCLDKNSDNFGDAKEFEEADEDGTVVGVRYIEKVRSCNLFRYNSWLIWSDSLSTVAV